MDLPNLGIEPGSPELQADSDSFVDHDGYSISSEGFLDALSLGRGWMLGLCIQAELTSFFLRSASCSRRDVFPFFCPSRIQWKQKARSFKSIIILKLQHESHCVVLGKSVFLLVARGARPCSGVMEIGRAHV